MNCYNHSTESAVAQCKKCNKGLCKNCTNGQPIPICSTCNAFSVHDQKKQIYFEMFTTFGVGLILVIIITNGKTFSLITTLSMFYGYSGIVPGWKILNSLMPKMVFSFSIFGFAFLLIKLLCSLFVGIIALPIRTYNNIRKLDKLKTN